MEAMSDIVHQFGGTRVLELAATGAPFIGRREVSDLIGAAASVEADIVAIPVARQGPDFLDLKTRQAGDMMQMCVTYGLKLAFVGDISVEIAGSKALRDFVYETNRGQSVWFVDDIAALERRLLAAA